MMNLNNLKNKIEKATIAIASVNKNNQPHNIFIMYAKVIDNKIVVTDNYMKTTIENIKNNPNLSLAFYKGETGFRIDGVAQYYNSGKWLEFVKKIPENKDCPAKGAIIIEVKEIKSLG